MSTLRYYLNEYLNLRQALGFKLRTHKSSLLDFVDFSEKKRVKVITPQLALLWAMKPANADPKWWAYRLRMVHHFARYVQSRDPATQVPSPDLLPYCQRRSSPYIYPKDEIVRLMAAAKTLPSQIGLRGWTYYTLFGLIWVTGLRISEALALNIDDVDLDAHLLHIRNTKFGKSRMVPLHPSTSNVLRNYTDLRDQVFCRAKSRSFFVTIYGKRPTSAIVQLTFRQLCRRIGIQPLGTKKGPRIHDIRHTFAVRTLIDLYKNDSNIDQGVHALSVYLGHKGPSSTYWYLSAVPELMELACQRFKKKEYVP